MGPECVSLAVKLGTRAPALPLFVESWAVAMTSTRRRPRHITQAIGITVGAVSVGWLALAPAGAEDTGRWEVLLSSNGGGFRSVARAPTFRVSVPALPRVERPRIISVPAPTVMKPATPPDPSKRENPLAAILHDSTLRYGDVVVFPDGPRMFKGDGGTRHSLRDFVSLSASRGLPPATRKKLLAMPVGDNSAWSSDLSSRGNRIAHSAVDVETTGSVTLGDRREKTVTVRTGRGDVRVIRVP